MTQEPPAHWLAVPVKGLRRWDVGYSSRSGRGPDSPPRRPLGELLTDLRYGSSARATADPVGVPVLRMGNIKDHSWDLSELKYADMSQADRERFCVLPGDVLINRTNTEDLVGKAAVWEHEGDWAFASYLIRLRVDRSALLPEFLGAWLNSADARVQIDKVKRRSAGMTNINATDIRGLLVPELPMPAQESVVRNLMAAREKKEELLRRAEARLRTARQEVAIAAGVAPAEPLEIGVYTTVTGRLGASLRLDTGFHAPSRLAAVAAVEAVPSQQLADVCSIRRHVASGPVPALGLGDIEAHTGRRVPASEPEVLKGALQFAEGDVLFGRLRPNLNKVWAADVDGYCSPEFRVLRTRAGVDAAGLAALLRCWFVVEQTRWVTTGNTHPRLSDDDLLGIRLPSGVDLIQLDHVYARAASEAFRFEVEAGELWGAAKAAFAEALAGY